MFNCMGFPEELHHHHRRMCNPTAYKQLCANMIATPVAGAVMMCVMAEVDITSPKPYPWPLR